MPTEFEKGLITGLLIGEGHFGGDGRQPQVTLRMHVRHEAIFRWMERTFPGGRLYGPYSHGGRNYYQWMARGSYLREQLLPVLADGLSPELDGPSYQRFQAMLERYAGRLGARAQEEGADGVVTADSASGTAPGPEIPASTS